MKKHRKTTVAVLCLFLCTCGVISADDKADVLASLKAEIVSVFGEEAKCVSISVEDADQVKLEYKTRKFMVYDKPMGGEWTMEQHEVTGPSDKGMIVHLVLLKTSELQGDQWQRPTDPRGATIAVPVREPYWEELIWVMPLEGKDFTARIHFSFGSHGTNTAIHKNLKTLFGKIR